MGAAVVTVPGDPSAVDEFESLQMARGLLVEPGAVEEVHAVEREVSSGEFHTMDELHAVLERRQQDEQDAS